MRDSIKNVQRAKDVIEREAVRIHEQNGNNIEKGKNNIGNVEKLDVAKERKEHQEKGGDAYDMGM